jgi:hypothetical protein
MTGQADDAPLLAALKADEVYRTSFNYTAGLDVETDYVIANGEGDHPARRATRRCPVG